MLHFWNNRLISPVSNVIRVKTACVCRNIEFAEHKFSIDRLDLYGLPVAALGRDFKKGNSMSATAAKPMTKTEVINTLADSTGLTKQQVNQFFDELTGLIAKNLKEGGPGVFNVPGMLKVKVVRKEAKPEREGKDPFTGETRMFKAQPAKNVVKVTALKKLKDAVQ